MILNLKTKDIKTNRGITLIALVITIIVLLILAGVTIVTLTGDNGLITKASDAKQSTTDAEIEEEIRLAWNKVYADNYLSNYTAEQKASALQAELIGKDQTATVTASGNELKVHYRGKDKALDIITGTLAEPISAVAKAKRDGTVFDEDNTPITDEFGNTFIVPKGFKIASDSAENVTEGIVIEDATYTNTIGSQFVWIPVSRDSTDANKVKGEKDTTILLSRYTFDDEGNPTDQGANTISSYYTESVTSSYGNAVAKTDITSSNGFIAKANAAGGFYIGRYEARTGTERSSTSDALTQITEKGTDYVYNYVTQSQASGQAQGMYASNNYFESDLINSYAWDTATLFLQEYDDREGNNLTPYSIQARIETNFISTGTTTDKICNIYDMASNCYEWSTETSSYLSKKGKSSPCVLRGGDYHDSYYYTSTRDYGGTSSAGDVYSFRPVLYIK